MNYQKELAFAVSLVKKLGVLMEQELRVGHASTLKKDGSHVTAVDTAINRQVIEAIKKSFPQDGVLGEEESNLHDTDKRVWICDPLDGTWPFTCGLPISLILLALVEDNKPVLGVAYNPYVKHIFTAVKGQGAFANGERVHVNKEFTTLKRTAIGLTGPNINEFVNSGTLLEDLSTSDARVQILGCTGYETMFVGAGLYGGQIFKFNTRHDVAVGDIFVHEAGGKVTDLFGKSLDYTKPVKGAIFSNGTLHSTLEETVKKHLIPKE